MRPVALLALLLTAADPKPITLQVRPRLAVSTIDEVHVEIRIPRHAENRGFCLVVEGPVSSLSCEDLDGEASRVLYTLKLLHFVEGHYVVRAELYRAAKGPYAVARESVQVGTSEDERP